MVRAVMQIFYHTPAEKRLARWGISRRVIWAGVMAFVLLASAIALFYLSSTVSPVAQPEARAPALPAELAATITPVSDPAALRPVTSEEAVRINAAMPFSKDSNPAAKPLYLPLGDGVNWLRALDCMTAAIYYEAANEPDDGQKAVAQVVVNRVRDPAFPNTVCGVVFEGAQLATGCQFSFTCDGSLARMPTKTGWARARGAAMRALSGYVFAPVGMATHYHADYVVPYWAPKLAKVSMQGVHIFYRWMGGRGLPAAFTARYAAAEEDIFGSGSLMGKLLSGQLSAESDGDGGTAQVALSAPSTRTVLGIDGASIAPPDAGRSAGVPPPQQRSGIRMLADIAEPPAAALARSGKVAGRWVIGPDGAKVSEEPAPHHSSEPATGPASK